MEKLNFLDFNTPYRLLDILPTLIDKGLGDSYESVLKELLILSLKYKKNIKITKKNGDLFLNIDFNHCGGLV